MRCFKDVKPMTRSTLCAAMCLATVLAGTLGGCQGIGNALGGGGGVMPTSEVGLPPSMRGSVKGAPTMTATVDDDGQPVRSGPARQLALPKTVQGENRSADAGPRRINREDIDDGVTSGRSSSGGLTPQMGSGGSVGLGGKF